MTIRPRAVTYRVALDALREAHLTLRKILETPFTEDTRAQLRRLNDRIGLLVERDDGHHFRR